MTVTMENESGQEFDFPYRELAEQVVEAVLDMENFPFETEVNVLLVTEEEIRAVNRTQRSQDQVTDVLSFPLIEYPGPGDFSQVDALENNFNPDTGEAMLGDILLCAQRVKEQAFAYGHSEKREYAFLIAHSMLHLLGYDHMRSEEASVMEGKQEKILQNMQIFRD